MPRYSILLTACIFSLTGSVFAQSASAVVDGHKTYDQKMRECRKSAADKGLSADAQRTAVAACMKDGSAKTR